MRLNLLFIVMDIITLLAWPFVYMDGKLRQYLKFRETATLTNPIVTDPVTP